MFPELILGNSILMGAILFAAGICVGSFLNVCIYRIPEEKSVIAPPSACAACGNRLKPIDLIPILSYILLGGKCRYCKSSISIQYPLVELLTGLIWVTVYLNFGFTFETFMLIYFFSILLVVAFIDLKHMIIPNGLVLAGIIGGLIVFVFHIAIRPFSLMGPSPWYTPLIGMVSASGILFFVALLGLLIYKDDGAMGMGDVKLFMPIGMFLGWKLSLLTLLLSVMLGGIISFLLLIFKIKDRKSAIPFGPFIVLATIISTFFGAEIITWYTGL